MRNKLFDEVIEESNVRCLKESIGQIGLFWFSRDYARIIKSEGEREIKNSDLSRPERIDPIGLHAEYDMPRDVPRGRISYEDKNFKIWVGEDCSLDDVIIIDMIKQYFNLTKIDSNKFKVKKHYHWNTKT